MEHVLHVYRDITYLQVLTHVYYVLASVLLVLLLVLTVSAAEQACSFLTTNAILHVLEAHISPTELA